MRSASKCAALFLLTILAGGPGEAASKPRSGTEALEEATGVKVDPVAFRSQVRSLARPFSGIVEGASDRILLAATTPEQRIMAMRLKVNAIPAIQGALFLSDPLAALFEVAGLLEQMEIYLTEGQGAGRPELVRTEAMAAIWEMERRIRDLGSAHGVPEEAGARFWAKAESWARRHPIVDSFVARETTQMLYAEHIRTETGRLRGLAKRLDENMLDLSLRFDLYAEYIAKQGRWQAELLAEEGLLTDLPGRIVDSLGPVPVAMTEMPVDIAAERVAFLEALAAERQLVLDWGEAQRREIEGLISSERKTVTGLVERERSIVIQELRGEREAVVAALDEQRGRLVRDIETLVGSTVEETGARLIDRAVWRVAQLLVVALVLLLLGSLAVVRYAVALVRQ